MKATLVEALIVAATGLIFALVGNALSPRGLHLTTNYFPAPPPSPTAAPRPPAPATDRAAVDDTTPAPAQAAARLSGRGLQVITLDTVTELFRDPMYDQGLVVFVDARDDRSYQAGHIPGAWQFHHYRAGEHLPTVLPVCLAALQVVVYCNGGECEDSEFAALVLRDAGVPSGTLFVFPGGMAEWKARGLPVETGARQSGKRIDPTR